MTVVTIGRAGPDAGSTSIQSGLFRPYLIDLEISMTPGRHDAGMSLMSIRFTSVTSGGQPKCRPDVIDVNLQMLTQRHGCEPN